MAVDPRNFILNTDYEMDKIIYFTEQKVTPGQYGDFTIPHNLGIAPLITGVWSMTSDFAVPHHFALPMTYYSSVDDEYKYLVDAVSCYADSNKILLELWSGSITIPPTTFPYYVRLIGFEPSNSTADLPSTSGNATQFILNTDYNYLKLHSAGVIPFPTSGSETITITHNLGYCPQALFWRELTVDGASEIRPLTEYATSTTYAPKDGIEAYNDRFVINKPQEQYGTDWKLHYRIYYDKAI